ncbi:reticulon-3-B [Drosophila sulfurigaster albostrigata]|uniref:reticulon-3-B n=1 Tax=Drosophila sulfurigaster albostrigata TaxID=89887 RepID=UPI002D21834C|nr:reticulon-3-B [Drosophila sulfurigaster albostrigata]XP_062134355.1 reticulon-3-B [Drosophila sulfurigaster albostrigata]
MEFNKDNDCKMGSKDSGTNSEFMQLILWRNWRKTSFVFLLMLMILMDIASNSIISVVSVFGVLIVLISMSYCCHIWGMRKLSKSHIMDHPYQNFLETDVSISEESAARLARLIVIKVNPILCQLRSLILIEDFVDSLKFLIALCGLNVLGDYINGMTMVLIGFVMLFTLPKLYEWKKPFINNQFKHLQQLKTRLFATKKKSHSSAPTVAVDPQVISSNRQKSNGIDCEIDQLNMGQYISAESDYDWAQEDVSMEDYQHYKGT